jgi:hypothetical protein
MDLEEGPNRRAVVVEVTAASPAFDAGIREGDVIVSVDGFAAKTYREWIDGIRRMVTDAPDGAAVAVEVLRNGKRVVTNVRTLESRVDDPLLPNLLDPAQAQPGSQGTGAAARQAANQPQRGIPGSNVFVNNAPFNDAFGADLSPAIDRAMAEIIRLEEHQQSRGVNETAAAGARPAAVEHTNSAETQTAGELATPPAGPEGRIGIAGFRDAQDGVLVLVDVGGLAPGSYRVSVEDPAIVLGQERTMPLSGISTPGAIEPQNSNTSPHGSSTTPSNAGTPPTAQVNPPATPPSGRVLPPAAPATGRVLPPGTSPVGLPADDPRVAGGREGESSSHAATGGAQAGTLSQVGVITVDENGTGTLQQVIEGIRVRDITGQAIVIHAPSKPSESTSTANPSTTSARAGGVTPSNQDASDAVRSGTAANRAPQQHSLPASELGQTPDSTGPIAAGIIRLLPDRRPTTHALQPGPGGAPQASQQRSASQAAERPEPNVSDRPLPGPQPQTR